MAAYQPTPEEDARLRELVAKYQSDAKGYTLLTEHLLLMMNDVPLVHSVKARMKSADSLFGKLIRKLVKAKEDKVEFDITPDNLFERITDLSGVRLLHLHTSQFKAIHESILDLISVPGYIVLEGPIARVWDHEYEGIFAKMGIPFEKNERMYTSVHYTVKQGPRSKRTAEIQVRTLAEELWGEVDHSFNYPEKTTITSCQEQIKVLARATSTCTRLVDVIYHTKEEAEKQAK